MNTILLNQHGSSMEESVENKTGKRLKFDIFDDIDAVVAKAKSRHRDVIWNPIKMKKKYVNKTLKESGKKSVWV